MKTRRSQKKSENMMVTPQIFKALEQYIGNYPAEKGAMLGRDPDGVIRHCAFDTGADCNAVEYNPDIPTLNKVIKHWKTLGIEFVGFIHSHPNGFIRPSRPDEIYSARILSCFKDLEKLWIPIAQTKPTSGHFKIYSYAAVPNTTRDKCQVVAANLEIQSNAGKPSTIIEDPRSLNLQECTENTANNHSSQIYGELAITDDNKKDKGVTKKKEVKSIAQLKMIHNRYFQRQSSHFDLDYLSQVRLVVIGTGGANSYIQSCARMGFGEFVLIDPDIISDSNIATQSVNPDDIGEYKVESIAKDIIKINPLAVVQPLSESIENIDDKQFKALCFEPMKYDIEQIISHKKMIAQPPQKTVLLVLTDNFYAQARGHRLGLNLGISTICAQAYKEGVGAEITYTVPGVTIACHRCITASRYKSYLTQGYENDVTSAGSPIFTAEYLNAVLGFVTLGVAYHGTDHPTWGDVITKRGDRNLLMLKITPNFHDVIGSDLVAKNAVTGAKDEIALTAFTTASLPQTPDYGQSENRPVCPDCGGCGDLTRAIGSMSDTKKMLSA